MKQNHKDFLDFFVTNGYKISLKGFLSNSYITINELLNMNFSKINLFLEYN